MKAETQLVRLAIVFICYCEEKKEKETFRFGWIPSVVSIMTLNI